MAAINAVKLATVGDINTDINTKRSYYIEDTNSGKYTGPYKLKDIGETKPIMGTTLVKECLTDNVITISITSQPGHTIQGHILPAHLGEKGVTGRLLYEKATAGGRRKSRHRRSKKNRRTKRRKA
jgi:hypothetical protein